jgi:hypothetical protein
VATGLAGLVKVFNDNVVEIGAAIASVTGYVKTGSQEFIGSLVDAINRGISPFVSSTVNMAKVVGDAFKNVVRVLDDAKAVVLSYGAAAQRALDEGAKMAQTVAGSLGDLLAGKVDLNSFETSMKQKMRAAIENAVADAVMKSVVMRQLAPILQSFSGMLEFGNFEGAKAQLGNIAKVSQFAAGAALPLMQSFKASLDSAFGSIPAMADGGIVKRPTLALIGEAGPEAVVPLGQMGGGQTVIQINNPTILNDRDADRLAETITRAMQRRRGMQFA